MNRKRIAFAAIALAGAALDIATKSLVFSRFEYGTTTTLAPGLWIQLATNRGIAWGLFASPLWSVVALAAVPAIATVYYRSRNPGWKETILGGLILAGTIGNCWDRLLLGYVRDWIRIPLIPNFNLADAMLTCSLAALSIVWIFYDRGPVSEARPAHPGQPDDGGLRDVGRDHGPRP